MPTVRGGLPRYAVSTDRILVIRDEAQSGTNSGRDGFQRLSEMIERGEDEILAVDDQSRLTRTDNVSACIQDLVFAGGGSSPSARASTPTGKAGSWGSRPSR